jgi:hypothetical protein
MTVENNFTHFYVILFCLSQSHFPFSSYKKASQAYQMWVGGKKEKLLFLF